MRSETSGAISAVSAPLVYIDTNVFIAGFESPAENAKPVQDLLIALRERPGSAVTSELTLAELLAPIASPKALPANKRRRLYFNLLIWSRLIELTPVTRDILIETADLRQVAPHRLPDAIHVVTAIRTKCEYFLSGDRRVRLPVGMIPLSPERSGIDQILSAWSQ